MTPPMTAPATPPTFSYDPRMARTFPALVTALLHVKGVPPDFDVADRVAAWEAEALRCLGGAAEAELPPIRAWRAAFSAMGLKPTQHRCASEALLRRLRKEGELPRLHPLVDLCNAASALHAVPVAAFDLDRVASDLTVRPATGAETYLTFGGDTEHPAPGEVVFADAAGAAHARRWTNRQSAASAVSAATRRALIVIEALHGHAEADVTAARDALAAILLDGGASVQAGLLRGAAGAFAIGGAA